MLSPFWIKRGFKQKSHGYRHRQAQMKFFSGVRFQKQVSNSGWSWANKVRDGRLGQFGL
jgi:hypothetical protein